MRTKGVSDDFLWKNRLSVLLVCPALLLVQAGPALAHKVSVFAWVEGDRVHTESKFSRGRPVKQGRVIVYDPQGRQLLEGNTDTQGRFSFPVPQRTALKIEIDAGTGHRAAWTVEEEEVGGGVSPSPGETAPRGPVPVPEKEPNPEAGSGGELTAAEVREIVDRSLDRKLAPVVRMLAESRDRGPSVTEILGGIGYILGLAGLAAYLQNRKRRVEKNDTLPAPGTGPEKS